MTGFKFIHTAAVISAVSTAAAGISINMVQDNVVDIPQFGDPSANHFGVSSFVQGKSKKDKGGGKKDKCDGAASNSLGGGSALFGEFQNGDEHEQPVFRKLTKKERRENEQAEKAEIARKKAGNRRAAAERRDPVAAAVQSRGPAVTTESDGNVFDACAMAHAQKAHSQQNVFQFAVHLKAVDTSKFTYIYKELEHIIGESETAIQVRRKISFNLCQLRI